tara:strand:+ start:8631 stop:9518 length:888 start_codon:yes stop_codon:yes gene_type:complete
MKILFHDFSNIFTTEPRYLHTALEQCQIDSQIWNNPQTSVYDALDMAKPDILISHYQALDNDIVKYLSQNKVELALNVTGATKNVLSQIDDLSNNVNIKLIYDNTYHKSISRSKKIKSDQIMPAADIFSPVQPVEQKFKLGILTSIESKQYEDEVNKEPVHHRLHLGVSEDKESQYDLDVDMHRLPSIIRMYDNIRIVDTVKNVCSQLFFEACLHGQNVNIIVPESEQESFTGSFAKVFSSDPEDVEDLATEIKDQIVKNHTPFHRASRLLKLLGDTEGNKKVENVKNQLQFQSV